MTRLTLVAPDPATGKVAQMLGEYRRRAGVEPGPMVRGMATSSALLRGHLDLDRAMDRAPLNRTVSEVTELKALGWREEQIADVVGLVALNVLTGASNLMAGIHAAEPAAAQPAAA